MDSMGKANSADPDCVCNAYMNSLITLSVILFAVTAILVPLRFYSRAFIIRRLWWDDVCLVLAFILTASSVVYAWIRVGTHYAQHLECPSPSNLLFLSDLVKMERYFFVFDQFFVRTAVALFIVRIFAVTRLLKRLLYGFIVFMAVVQVLTTILTLIECVGSRCLPEPVQLFNGYFNGAAAIFSDVVLAVMPAYFLLRIKTNIRRRAALICMMAFGLLPAACAVGRTIWINDARVESDPVLTFLLLGSGLMELDLLIIGAALPGIPPLFNRPPPPEDDRIRWFNDVSQS